MKRLLILSLTLIALTGCVSLGDRTFPEVPAELMVACPDLKLVDPNTTKLSDVLDVVTDNYAQYKSCQVQVDAWINWYNTQKDIFKSVK